VLEFGKDLFDGIEVGTVGRQEEEPGTGGADGFAGGFALVAAEIVHDDDIARPQHRNENLLDIGEEGFAVDRAIDDAGGIDAVMAECRQEGERAPMTVRRFGNQLPAARPPAAQRRHVGLGPSLIDEDQAARIETALILLPLQAPTRDGGPILLACEQRFF